MKRHVRILLTTLAVVLATLVFAFAIGSTHSPLAAPHPAAPRPEHDHGHDATVPQHHSDHPTPLIAANHERDCALADLHAHAQRHFGAFNAHLASFGGTTDWSPGFSLHWLDVEHDSTVVRLYHATDRQHPERRFIWMWHSGDPQPAAWEEVR